MTTTLERPADSAGELYFKTDVSPEVVFQAIGRLRKGARDEIDRLIRFLDETDDHMELEPDGTEDEQDDEPEDTGDAEPSLGSSGHSSGGPISYLAHAVSDGYQMVYDCEGDEHDGAEPEEIEANLGSLDREMDQRRTMLVSGIDWSVADGELG